MKTRTPRPPLSSEKSYDLIRRLGSRNPTTRRAAQAEFLRMAIQAPALFHADLADIIQVITAHRRRTPVGIVALTVALIAFSLSYTASFIQPLQGALAVLATFLTATGALLAISLTLFGIFKAALSHRNRRLAECITDIDDINALPALIELMEFASPDMLPSLSPPLTRLLLRVRASDGHLLGSLHRAALARALTTPRTRTQPASFFVAILQVFEQIADSQALPMISRLAQGKGAAHNDPAIQNAAHRCLTNLQAQLRRHHAPYLLLRPSSPADDSHALLHPTVTAPDNAQHELLRTATTHTPST